MEFESDHADVARPPFRLVKPDSPDRVDLVIRWAASMCLDTNRATIITFLFPIRDGVLASIELPADLTKGEPRRLAAFVDSLAIDGATDGGPAGQPPPSSVTLQPMADYRPDVYRSFRERFPEVAGALDELGRTTEAAGSLDVRTQRLVKLGIAIGALAEGAVRSTSARPSPKAPAQQTSATLWCSRSRPLVSPRPSPRSAGSTKCSTRRRRRPR